MKTPPNKSSTKTAPTLQVVMRAVASLVPFKRNAKDHPPEQVDALARLIQRVGFRFPLAIDEHSEIIAGHGRLLAAKNLRMSEVPCIVHSDLSDEDKRALRIADNRLAELAQTNQDNLALELGDLFGAGFDTSLIGFNDEERAKILAPEGSVEVEDIDVSEVKDEFWMSIRGPLPKEPEALDVLRAALANIEGVDVQIGTTAVGGL